MLGFFSTSPKTGDPLLNSKAGQIKNNTKAGMIGTKFYKPSGPLEVEETELEKDEYLALVEKNATSPEGLSPEEVHQIRLYENLHGKTPISRYEHIVKLYRSFIQQYKEILDTADLSTGRKFLEHLRELNDKIKKIEQAQDFPETPLAPIPKVQEYTGEDVEAASAEEQNERPEVIIPSGPVGGAGSAAAAAPAVLNQRTMRNMALGEKMRRLSRNKRAEVAAAAAAAGAGPGALRKTRKNANKRRARNL